MSIEITKREIESNTPLEISLNVLSSHKKRHKGFFKALFQGKVAYSIYKDTENNCLQIYCSPCSKGLPLPTLSGNSIILHSSKRSQGSSLHILKLPTEPSCPKPEWIVEKPLPVQSAEVLNREQIKCSLLQNHLVEVYQVLVKQRRNSAKRTWMLGRTAFGTFACVNEANRFIQFESMRELLDWGSFLSRHFADVPGPFDNYFGSDKSKCIIDCASDLEVESKIGVLKLYEIDTAPDPAIPCMSNPKKCWTLIKLNNGLYAACNSSKNQTWFVDHTFKGVLGNIKSDFIFYTKSPKHSVEWESDLFPTLFETSLTSVPT